MDEFEYSEQQRSDAVRRWLRENGLAVSLGMLCGTSMVCGWVFYKDYRDTQAEAASPIFSELMEKMSVAPVDQEQVGSLAKKLREEYTSTTYAQLAALAEAKAAVVAEDFDAAAEHLQWVIEQSDSTALQHLARLRLARLRLYGGEAGEARQLLEGAPEAMRGAYYQEVLGDLLRREGKVEEARQAYRAALDQSTEGSKAWIQPKLDNLGSHPVAPTAAPDTAPDTVPDTALDTAPEEQAPEEQAMEEQAPEEQAPEEQAVEEQAMEEQVMEEQTMDISLETESPEDSR